VKLKSPKGAALRQAGDDAPSKKAFDPGAALEGLPAWMEGFPPGLRSQGGLMMLAGAAVFVLFVLIYVGLRLAHVV
jgi:hypothetical protein